MKRKHLAHRSPPFLHDARIFLKKNRLKLILLVFLAVITYLNALGNGFVSDDINGLTNNRALQSFSSVTDHPTSFISPLYYFVMYKVFGIHALPFHLVSLITHIKSTLLVFLLFSFFSDGLFPLIGAVLFCIHPLLSEPVVWISANNYLFYSLFFLVSFNAYLLFRKYHGKYWYVLSILAFLLSLFSSDKAYFLFLVFPVYELTLGHFRKSLRRLSSYVVLGVAFLTLGVMNIGPRLTALQPESTGATSWNNPLVQIPFALASYLRLFFFPDTLTLYHTEYFTDSFLTTVYLIIFIIFLGSLIIAYQKQKTLFFWLVFFIIGLLPSLTPFRIANLVAERYAYLPSIGLIFVFSYLLYSLIRIKRLNYYAWGLFAIIVLALVVRTAIRNRDWKNDITLGISARNNPKASATKFENSGNAYLQQGNFPAAINEFNRAIALRPEYADLYNNVGYAYAHLNRLDEAKAAYDKAIRLNPKLWQTYDNYAAVFAAEKNYPKAEEYLLQATKVSPNNNDLIVHLGIVYLMSGDKKRAKEQFSKALVFDPNNREARDGLKKSSQ